MSDHLDLIKDNLTNMEGCFEILIPKNVFQDQDLDFDALLRGEATHHNSDPSTLESYKDVSAMLLNASKATYPRASCII